MANSDWRLGMRVAAREKIFEPASLSAGAKSARVHMLDVSTGGAKIHCPTPLAIGASVVLAWAEEERIAHVAWSAGARCGLQFRTPLTTVQIEALTQPVAMAATLCSLAATDNRPSSVSRLPASRVQPLP